jgi:hypothetical protein
MLPADTLPGQPIFRPAHALLAVGFFVWAFFSLLPGAMERSEAFRIREAWDTGTFWMIGVPMILLAQAMAGAARDARIFVDPLFMLGGIAAGLMLVHPAGNDLALLPLTIVFIGVPGYAVLLAAQAIGWGAGRLIRG